MCSISQSWICNCLLGLELKCAIEWCRFVVQPTRKFELWGSLWIPKAFHKLIIVQFGFVPVLLYGACISKPLELTFLGLNWKKKLWIKINIHLYVVSFIIPRKIKWYSFKHCGAFVNFGISLNEFVSSSETNGLIHAIFYTLAIYYVGGTFFLQYQELHVATIFGIKNTKRFASRGCGS